MASYRTTPSGAIEASLYVKGKRDSATFDTKAEAKAWAVKREAQLLEQKSSGVDPSRSVLTAFDRYASEESPKKRGGSYEQKRLKLYERFEIELPGEKRQRFVDIKLHELEPKHYAALRDMRGKMKTKTGSRITPSTVAREMNLISRVFNICVKEWGWLKDSPSRYVSRPKGRKKRERRISDDEIERLCFALNFKDGEIAVDKIQRVAVAFLLAIETAMRAGELLKLHRRKPKESTYVLPNGEEANKSWLVGGKVAKLGITKNGDGREVPLSPRAQELIAMLPMMGEKLFGDLDTADLDALFRGKGTARAAIEDLKFHDSRHEAISRLAKHMQVLDLARMTGHRNLNELLTYYHTTAEELADKMAVAHG